MPVPTAYTEATLAAYMHNSLGPVAEAMNYAAPSTDAGIYVEAMYETLFAYGVSDIASATDIRKLRALARREVWRKVVDETAGHYDVDADDASYKRSQLHKQASENFEAAATAAAAYDDSVSVVEVADIVYSDAPDEDDEDSE